MKRVVILIFLLGLMGGKVMGQDENTEAGAHLKAMYIYNISKYIEWPADKQTGDFLIGLLGENSDLKAELEKLSLVKQVGKRKIAIVEFKNFSEVNKYVNILFYDRDLFGDYNPLAFPSTLVVSQNTPNFNSIMISFVRVDFRLKIALNKDNIEKAGLKIAPALFDIAFNYLPVENTKEWSNIYDLLHRMLANGDNRVILDKSDLSKLIAEEDKKIKEIESQQKDLDEKSKSINKQSEKITLQETKLNFLENETKIKVQSLNVMNDEIGKQKEILKKTTAYIEKQKADILSQNKVIANKEEKITTQQNVLDQQKTITLLVVGGLLIVLLLAGFIFRSLRIRNKQNKIIVEQKSTVEKQKSIVEQKNIEITQSIEYALRIQTAILPPQKIVKQYLENSFILYKPKDIVAGDFYWMETVEIKNERNGEMENDKKGQNSPNLQITNSLILFAACDCTGHGVPGAMVSVVCHNALNRAVREFGLTQPSLILDKAAEIVIENFSKSEEDILDGMDISLVSLKFDNQNSEEVHLEWAGANNPLWLIKNKELVETKANKKSIGLNEDDKPFTNHTFTLTKGDSIYLFTDGFADQFGGELGQKKLTRKRFKDLILSIQDKSISEQGIALDKFIVNYRKEIEQIDDILVMGVRV